MAKYFIHDGQNEKGPLGIEQLKLEFLKNDTPIWYEGLDNWTTVEEVKELMDLIVSKQTPPPLKKNIDVTAFGTSLPIDASLIENPSEPATKKLLKISLVFAIIIIVLCIVCWLGYQNKSQAEVLNQVQERVTQQSLQLVAQQEKEQKRSIEEQQLQGEKDRINAIITEKYMGYRNNWRRYIKAVSNNFSYSDMGGISNLEVLIYNQTDKTIEEVQVKVDYIKSNGGTYKSEMVSVTNIGPNSTKSVSAPSSDRGTSVQINIESISAKSFHFCFPYGMDGDKNLDPYYCK